MLTFAHASVLVALLHSNPAGLLADLRTLASDQGLDPDAVERILAEFIIPTAPVETPTITLTVEVPGQPHEFTAAATIMEALIPGAQVINDDDYLAPLEPVGAYDLDDFGLTEDEWAAAFEPSLPLVTEPVDLTEADEPEPLEVALEKSPRRRFWRL